MEPITTPPTPVRSTEQVRAKPALTAVTYTTTVAPTHVPRVWSITTRARVAEDSLFAVGADYEEAAWDVLESNWLHGETELVATAEAVVWHPEHFDYVGLMAAAAQYDQASLQATALRLAALSVNGTLPASHAPQRVAILGDVEVKPVMSGHQVELNAAAHCLYAAGAWVPQVMAASIGRAITPADEWKIETVLAKNLLGNLGFSIAFSDCGPVCFSAPNNTTLSKRIIDLVQVAGSAS